MYFHLHPYTIFSILSALISLLASLTALRRSAPGSSLLSLLLLSTAIWSVFYSTRWMNISLETKIFWSDLMYIGVACLPTLFLLFVLAFTHNDQWLTKRNFILFFIPPILSIVLNWTNAYHHLFYLSIKAVQENGFMILDVTRGAWYYVNTLYSYALIGIALLVLSHSALRSSPLYLNQYRLLLIASILPWAGSAYSEFRFVEWHGLDPAPLMFGITGMIFALSVRRTHFMDLIPVARSHLIDNMHDGVLVVDAQDRIVDINPAMENFLEGKISSYMGRNASELFVEWKDKIDSLWDEKEMRAELSVPKDASRYLDLRVTPLYDKSHSLNGRLIVFRDITERKQVEKRLRYVNSRLQSQLVEIGLLQSKLREQAIRDPLTNLFNRRYLEDTLDHELARAAREGYPVGIFMIDLDHFKRVNDTYGHEAGDYLLKAIASTLSRESRRGDFACRYGGEEFVVVMPNITKDVAYERAGELRNALNSLYVPYQHDHLSITISMGVACYPMNGETRETILRAADQAMYAAKEAGRNHILSYDEIHVSRDVLEDNI